MAQILQGELLDLDTGELFEFKPEDGAIVTIAEERAKKTSNWLKYQSKQAAIEDQRLYSSEMGEFIFIIYRHCQKEKILDRKELARLVYLATYVSYDGKLVNSNGKPLHKEQIKKKLKVSNDPFYKFYNKLLENEIIKEDQETNDIYLNKHLFFKGDVKTHKKYLKDSNFIRLYIKNIRYLYEHVKPKNHSQLGLIYALIPYVNLTYNILCINPEERELEKIKVLTLQDVGNILGYHEKSLTRLRNELLKIRLEDDSNVIVFIEKDPGIPNRKIIINPKILGAKVYEGYEVIHKYF